MNAKRPRFQFRLSTMLLLMLFSAVWLGLNLYPTVKKSVIIRGDDLVLISTSIHSKTMEIILENFSIYGWPFGVYVQNGPQYDVPNVMGPVTQEDIEKHYGIQKSFRTSFITNLEHGAIVWKALFINLGIYVASMLLLYWLLERKWKKPTSPPASNAG